MPLSDFHLGRLGTGVPNPTASVAPVPTIE